MELQFRANRDLTPPLLKRWHLNVVVRRCPGGKVCVEKEEWIPWPTWKVTLGGPKSAQPNLLVFTEMAEMGKKRIENFVDAQKELINQLQEANRQWFDRMQSEAKVASDFANKVMGPRSIPDAMTAYGNGRTGSWR